MYYPHPCPSLQFDLSYPLSFPLDWSLDGEGGFNKYYAIKACNPLLATDSNVISAQEGRPVQQGQVCSFDGVDDYIAAAHLAGTETVVSSWGVTPTVSAGRIDFPVGNAANVLLSDGTQYNLNHVSGTVAYDSSGNGNDGTLVNGAAFVADATLPAAQDKLNLEGFTQRVLFDGVDDSVDIDSIVELTGDFTIKCTIVPNAYNGGSSGILGKATTSNDGLYLTGSGLVNLRISSTNLSMATSVIPLNEVSVLVVTRVGGDYEVTRNGVSIGTSTHTANTLTITELGKRGSGSFYHTGLLYDVELWDAGVLINSYIGNGNEDVNWEDQIGSNDGTVNGSPTNVLIPRDESDITKDVLGNPLQWSGSVYAHDFLRTQSYAGEFDGVDDYVNILNSDGNNLGVSSWTISFWMKATALSNGSSTFPAVMGKGDTGGGEWMIRSHNNNTMGFYRGGNLATVSGLVTGKWYHLTFSYDGVNMRAYRDGAIQATVPFSTSLTSNKSLRLGNADGATNRFYNGQLFDVRIYKGTVLSVDDITNVIANNSILANTTSHHALTEGVGDTSHDISGNNNHGTIVNASTATEGAGFWAGRIDGDANAHNLNDGHSRRMLFDRANDRVTGTFAFNSATDAYVEIESYIPNTRLGGSAGRFFSHGNDSTGNNFGFEVKNNGAIGVLIGGSGGGGQHVFTSTATLSNGYNKVRVTFSGGNLVTILVNDSAFDSGAITATTLLTSAAAFAIGAINTANGGWVSGVLYNSDINNQSLLLGSGNTDADWVDQVGSSDGTVSGSPALIRIPADSTAPTLDVYGNTLTNPAIPEWHNGAETILDLRTAIDGAKSPAINQADPSLPDTYTYGDAETTTFQFTTDTNGNTGRFLALPEAPDAACQVNIDKYHS